MRRAFLIFFPGLPLPRLARPRRLPFRCLIVAAFSGVCAAPPSQSETRTDQAEGVFRFHVASEPHTLDPAQIVSDSAYLFSNLMRGLYRYSPAGLQGEGARQCEFQGRLKLVCALNTAHKWSDGQMVTAFEYERSFRRLLDPRSKTAAIELLMNLKNAAKIRAEGLSSEKLGVTALNARTLVFEFDRPDPDFLFKLAATVLVPVRSEAFPIREGNVGFLSNGPYKIAGWSKGRRILLEANSHYPFGAKDRPPVEVVFVDAAETALNLYQKRILTFLRSLPTHHMAKYETRPDFHNVPMSRFDYIGFGDELRDQPDLRAALSLSADYEELRKLLRALGRPGCPGLPGTMLDRPSCLAFDLKKAKSHLSRVAKKARQRRYRLAYSHLGGDDHKKVAEWFQYQWKKNLGIQVDIESTENAVFLHRLKTAPPPLFRKGLSLDRPTCLAALETFSRNGVENFLRLNDAKYEDLLAKLAAATEKDRNIRHGNQPDLPASAVKRACGDGIRHLLARHLLIPLGRIHFSILADPRFPGWTLNELNQLDLSNLRFDPGSKSGSESPH